MKKITLLLLTVVLAAASCNSVKEPEWFLDKEYQMFKAQMYNELPVRQSDIVMLGDDYIDDAPWSWLFVSQNGPTVRNRGIRGDGIPHVMYRLDSIVRHRPAKIFLSVGINDLYHGSTIDEVHAGIDKIFAKIKKASPKTECYYLTIVPGSRLPSDVGIHAIELNKNILMAKNPNYTVLDINHILLNGVMSGEYSRDGGRHLNGNGYTTLTMAISGDMGLTPNNLFKDSVDFALSPVAQRTSEGGRVNLYGWHKGSIYRTIPFTVNQILMLGNGLVDRGEWRSLLEGFKVEARGIEGETLSDLAWRIDNAGKIRPAKIFLAAGGDDLLAENANVDEIWGQYTAIVAKLQKEMPKAKIYVHTVPPMAASREGAAQYNGRVKEFNSRIKAAGEEFDYICVDLAELLADENGNLDPVNTVDGYNLSVSGYFKWCAELLGNGRVLVIGNPYHND